MSRDAAVQAVIDQGDSLLRVSDLERVTGRDFINAAVVIVLIHGFTSHGIYLRELGNYLEQFGAKPGNVLVALFNYNSLKGVPRAALSLKGLLVGIDKATKGEVTRKGIFLVAHSMGGLVARELAIDADMHDMIRGLVMLGTPNNGSITRANTKIIEYFIFLAEYLAGPIPQARKAGCVAVKQLTKTDTEYGGPYLDHLNARWTSATEFPPTLSISGGRNWQRFCTNRLLNYYFNNKLQGLMGGADNDGLVEDVSVNLNSCLAVSLNGMYAHLNSYPQYRDLNHTNLTKDQALSIEIFNWIQDRLSS